MHVAVNPLTKKLSFNLAERANRLCNGDMIRFKCVPDEISFKQGGKRPGGETGSPLLGQCVMRRRTGTSAPSALPVQLMAAKNLLSTNRK